MAVRKETIKQQFAEAMPAVLEPGEQVQAGAYCISGPNPLWSQGLLGMLSYAVFGMRYYYLAVTDRRVLFMKASLWSARPQGLAFADPRDSVTISDVHTDAKLWNWCKYTGPTKQDLRLNFHAFWRDEMRQLVQILADRTQGTVSSAEPPPPPAPTDPAPGTPPPPPA